MTKHFDKSRPYGEYHPPHKGARYEQDGFAFAADGTLVEALLTPKQKEQLAKLKTKAPAAPAAARPAGPETGETQPEPEPAGDEINLVLWLKDDKLYNFNDVRPAIRSRFSRWESSKVGAVRFLVEEQKLVELSELDPDLKALLDAEAEQAA